MKYPALLISCAALLALAATEASFAGHDLHSVNGSVSANAGESYDSISTVNGSVRVGKGASADVAKTVNGRVSLDDEAKVGDASTVNGSLELGEGATVARDASTVNGTIKLASRARVGGDVTTVSGSIKASGADIGGEIKTRNGDIDLADGTRVHKGLRIEKPNSEGWSWKRDEPNHVRICATCVVEGDLVFERPVDLTVEPGAKIGKVIGDQVTRH